MGIPRYFNDIMQKYPSIASVAGDVNMDFLFFDFNGIVYICHRNLVRKGVKYVPSKKKEYEKDLINEVIAYVQRIVCTIVKPSKLLYIAIDGPPPRAKMVQQRWRRFKKPLEDRLLAEAREIYGEKEEPQWPANHNTSPGTEFMAELSNSLQKAISEGIFNKHNKKMRTVLSDASVPGEGEHKIIPYLRKIKSSPGANYCIYGMDGDLLVLVLTTQKDNIYILREPQADGMPDALKKMFEDVELIYVNMNEFRDRFIDDHELKEYDHRRILLDYTFLTFLSGNDFIPPLPGMTVAEQGLDRSLKIYDEVLKKRDKNNYLVDQKDGRSYLNISFFKSILEELGKQEWHNLKRIQQRNKMAKYRNKLGPDASEYKKYLGRLEHSSFYSIDNPQYEKYIDQMMSIDYLQPKDVWKNSYYKHFMGVNNEEDPKEYANMVRKVSIQYMEALMFCIKYYTEGCPAWRWYYQFRAAPFVSDIQRVLNQIKNANSYFKFDIGKPFTPLNQLMLIMPPQANHLLPKKLGALMTDIKSPIIDLYPIEFELDVVQGKKFWKSEPVLPYQDADRVLELTDPIIKKLPKADRDRNKVGKDVLRFNFDTKNKYGNKEKEIVFSEGGAKKLKRKKGK